MSGISRKLTDLIGNTPLLELTDYNRVHGVRGRLTGKLEYFNPLGSVKDRIALAMIEDAERRGLSIMIRSLSSPPVEIQASALPLSRLQKGIA